MGQAQSGVITVDEFKDRVMGAVVVLLSSQLDPKLKFKPTSQISLTDSHVLPILSDGMTTNMEKIIDLYSSYYSDENRDIIDKYVSECILSDEQSVNKFISLMINQLMKKPNYFPPKKAPAQVPAPAIPKHEIEDAASVTFAPSVKSAAVKSAAAPSVKSAAAPSVKSAAAPSVKSFAAPSVKSFAAPSVKSFHVSPLIRDIEPTIKSVRVGTVKAEFEEFPELVTEEHHESLRDSQRVTLASAHRSSAMVQPVAPLLTAEPISDVHSTILASLEAPTEELKPVKGSNKLQKRMHTLSKAIDNERRVQEAKQNISASYVESEGQMLGEPSALGKPESDNEEAVLEEHHGGSDSHDEFEHI